MIVLDSKARLVLSTLDQELDLLVDNKNRLIVQTDNGPIFININEVIREIDNKGIDL